MKLYTLPLLMLLTVGCRGVNRLLGQDGHDQMPNQSSALLNDYYVTGTTTKDHQTVYMPITGRTITIEVMLANDLNWTVLQKVDSYSSYQLFTIPQGGVYFGDRADKDAQGSIHYYTGTPSAPTGTPYRIHSVAN